jgi:hypothetical protein
MADTNSVADDAGTTMPSFGETSVADRLVEFHWIEDEPVASNFEGLARTLSKRGDLYHRQEGGLLLIRADGDITVIEKGSDLAPVIIDRVALTIFKDGKPRGTNLSMRHHNAMLLSDSFLSRFRTIDRVTDVPAYLPDFTLTQPGVNDGGRPHRIFYRGQPPEIADSTERIEQFLDVMQFHSNADRTNAVAAALTVMLRNHWPGGKPILVVTATKSHSGKDTVILFASGLTPQCSISYQSTDWALERSLVGALNNQPDTGLIIVENARLTNGHSVIASSILERLATDPEPLLFSPGTGHPRRRRNDLVLAISTNFGTVSEDILNRSLPIHLSPTGNVTERELPIGNPKLQFLPRERNRIAAELRYMVERWRGAGMPRNTSVRHPFTEWAEVVGGILQVNGFESFLDNYRTRQVSGNPLREALAILGASRAGSDWLPPETWVREMTQLNLDDRIIQRGDRGGAAALQRGIGKVLSAHVGETFTFDTEAEVLTLRLEKHRARFGTPQPHVRYRFAVVHRVAVPEDPIVPEHNPEEQNEAARPNATASALSEDSAEDAGPDHGG